MPPLRPFSLLDQLLYVSFSPSTPTAMRALFSLLTLVLLATAASAQSQSVVLTPTDDGIAAVAPSLSPVGTAPAALVTWTGNGWHLQSLSTGDVPAEVAVEPPRTPSVPMRPGAAPRPPIPPSRPGLTPRLVEIGRRSAPQSHVRYTVLAENLPAEATLRHLADLDENDKLVHAKVETQGAKARIDLVFAFESVEEWAAWNERTRFGGLFADSPDVPSDVRRWSRLEVSRAPRTATDVYEHGEIIDID